MHVAGSICSCLFVCTQFRQLHSIEKYIECSIDIGSTLNHVSLVSWVKSSAPASTCNWDVYVRRHWAVWYSVCTRVVCPGRRSSLYMMWHSECIPSNNHHYKGFGRAVNHNIAAMPGTRLTIINIDVRKDYKHILTQRCYHRSTTACRVPMSALPGTHAELEEELLLLVHATKLTSRIPTLHHESVWCIWNEKGTLAASHSVREVPNF